MNRHLQIMAVISFVFVFLNISSFNTLGVVLSYMIEDLNWTFTEAGFSYTLLGIACGMGSLLPMISLKVMGARNTVASGCVLLFSGFALCTFGSNIMLFYLAMVLVGLGFAMAGNLPGVWIIGATFPKNTARIIGYYMMSGAVGAIIGPPLIQRIVAFNGWRFHWGVMAVVAIACLLLALFVLREPLHAKNEKQDTDDVRSNDKAEDTSENTASSEPKLMDGIRTPIFATVALCVTLLLTAVTTISAVGVNHLKNFGSTTELAALSLGFFAFIGATSKGAAGYLCEQFGARRLLAVSAILQGCGLLLFANADSAFMTFFWAAIFGSGWGACYVACTVVLIDSFGHELGARLFAAAHTLATVAAFGPLAAGVIADNYGTFAPVFYVLGLTFLLSAVPAMMIRRTAKIA